MQNRSRLFVAALAVLVLGGAAAVAAPPPRNEVAVVRLDGEIDTLAARAFIQTLDEVLGRNPRFVVIEVDAMASDIDPVHYIVAKLTSIRRPAETVAHITGHASGAIPLAVLSCDHIAMGPRTTLGECGKLAGPELAKELAEAAASRGYPEAIAAAMGGRPGPVLRVAVETPQGAVVDEYVPEEKLATWSQEKLRRVISRERVEEFVERLDPQAARRLGLARWAPADRAELVGELEVIAHTSLTVREAGAVEGSVDGVLAWLARKGLLPLFLFLGLLGIAIEISHPSLVFPGVLGVICLAVALSGGHMAGLTSAFDLCLIVGGIVLILIEMFVIPGFGAAGIIGILALLAGAFLAFQESPWPTNAAQTAEWRAGARTFALGLGGTIVAFAAIARLLPSSPLLSRFVNSSSQRPEDGYTVAPASRVAFVGRVGVAATDLRPSGKVAIEDQVVDAISDGRWVPRGAAVEVIETSENRLVVKQKA